MVHVNRQVAPERVGRERLISAQVREIARLVQQLPDEVVASFAASDPQARISRLEELTTKICFGAAPFFNWLERHRDLQTAKENISRIYNATDEAVKCAGHEIPEYAGGKITPRPGCPAPSPGAERTAILKAQTHFLAPMLFEWADEIDADTASKIKDKSYDKMILLSEARKLFGFKSNKELMCFLERYPDVKQDRPLAKNGKPHSRRRNVSVLGLVRAISQDDKILSDPARKKRMETRLKRATFKKETEDEALRILTGKNT